MKINKLFSIALIIPFLTLSTGFVNPKLNIPLNIQVDNWEFAEFLSYFEKVDNSFSVGLSDLHQYQERKVSKKTRPAKSEIDMSSKQTLMKFIPGLRSGMFSRMGPPEVMPVARFYPNEQTIAVIYMTYQPFRTISDLSFHLAFFDLKGNNLPRQKKEKLHRSSAFNLANVSVHATETFNITQEGFIWKNTYENIWKMDVGEAGLADNEIVDYKLNNTAVFQIKGNGLVEMAKDYPIDSKASLD